MLRTALRTITQISPVDGRYAKATEPLSPYFSESALIRHRLEIEVRWFIHLSNHGILKTGGNEIRLTPGETETLEGLYKNFTLDDANWVKEKERETNHDLKAVEYFVKSRLTGNLKDYSEFFHILCTSEDINNLSWSLMISKALSNAMLPRLIEVHNSLDNLAKNHAHDAMISRTHGQVATPTTLGKEMANFDFRLLRQINQLKSRRLLGKCNGAVGNFNAHVATYPESNWVDISQSFIESLGMEYNPYTTQIEPHDSLAEVCGNIAQANTVLMDLVRDMWQYFSVGYFKPIIKEKEVGSSTMPHKVNPIDFENAEGNLGVANSILTHLQHKLPVSRLQRDLSDSTALRNLGTGFANSYIAYNSINRGFGRVTVNSEKLAEELNLHWEVLAEPIQMILRKHGIEQPYELLKKLTRGKSSLNEEEYMEMRESLIKELSLKPNIALEIRALNPSKYLGIAPALSLLADSTQ